MSDGNLPPRPPGGSSSGLPKSIGAPVWSITRRERKEVTPPAGRSREGSEEATDSVYQSRTMTSTERVQIVQMPLELSEASVEQLRMLTLSPRTEASREVCTTSTTIEAGSVPLIGGVTNNGVHLINGVYLHGESRQTTTIITTTTTSYKILEDEASGDEFEMIDFEDKAQPSALSLEMPLRISSRTDDEFVMVKEGTESSITSTSEDEGPVSSLTSADEIEEETKTMHGGIAKTSIVVIPSRVRSPPYSPQSFANTSTFSSPSSRGSIELIPQDKEERLPKWEKLIVGKLNATKLERELEEEPLQNWIILSDGRREISTQTAKPKKKPSITWSPQMEIASTSKVGEHKSIPIDDYVQIYSKGYANEDEKFEKETLTKAKTIKQKENTERIWKKEGLVKTYPHPELEAVPVMDKIERIHKGFYEEGQMPTVVHEERELTPSEAEKRPGTLERITHLFTKRTATGEEWPTITEPYTGTLAETNRRAELAENSFGEHVSAYASGRSDEIGQQAVTTIVREHYPAAVAYEGPLSETAQHLELEGAPLNSHVTVYHHGRSDLEETPLAAPEPITEKVTTKISSLFKRKTHHEDFPVSEPFTGPLSETNRVPELRREPIDAMVNVYSTGRSDEFAAAEPITIAKVEPETIVEYPRMAAYEGPLQSTSKGVELEGQPLEAHVTAYHHGRSDVVPATMETITSKLTSIFKKTTTHGEDYPPKSEPFLGPVAQTYRHPELEAVPVMDKIERIHKGFYEEGQMPTVVHEERELTPSEAEKRPRTLEWNENELTNSILDLIVLVQHHGFSDLQDDFSLRGSIETIETILVRPLEGPNAIEEISSDLSTVPTQILVSIPERLLIFAGTELVNFPIDKAVAVYHHGFSFGVESVFEVADEKEQRNEIQLGRSNEMGHILLEGVVAVYHHGWYGEEKQFGFVEANQMSMSLEQEKQKLDYEKESPKLTIMEPVQMNGHTSDMNNTHFDDQKGPKELEKKPPENAQTLVVAQEKRTDGKVSFKKDLVPPTQPLCEPLELHVRIKQVGSKLSHKRDFDVPFGFETERTREIYSRATSLKDEQLHSSRPPLRQLKAQTLDEQRYVRSLPRSQTSFPPRGEDLSIDSSNKTKPRAYYVPRYAQPATTAFPCKRPMGTIQSTTEFSADRAPSPGSQRQPSWTTITETTQITYAKRHSFEQTVNGRKQHVVEDIIVYNHGGPRKVPPGLPKSPMKRQRVLPSQYLDERYHNISGRYNYYRSRSQDNDRPRTHDKWLQTDDESTSPFRRSESRSIRTVSRSEERTYRAYSSQLYDRHAHIRGDYTSQKDAMELNEHFTRGWSTTKGQKSGDNRPDAGMRREKVPPASSIFPVNETSSTFNIQRTVDASVDSHHYVNNGRTFTHYSSSLQQNAPASRTVQSLHYQKANIEELPISQLLREIPHLWDGNDSVHGILHHNGTSLPLPSDGRKERTVPLETRLMDPGEHFPSEGFGSDRRRHSAPIRRARQRISNYCTML